MKLIEIPKIIFGNFADPKTLRDCVYGKEFYTVARLKNTSNLWIRVRTDSADILGIVQVHNIVSQIMDPRVFTPRPTLFLSFEFGFVPIGDGHEQEMFCLKTFEGAPVRIDTVIHGADQVIKMLGCILEFVTDCEPARVRPIVDADTFRGESVHSSYFV